MIVKQMDIRANIKKYFDLAYSGNTIFVPRKDNKNIVIISEAEYNRICRSVRITAYSDAIVSHAQESAMTNAAATGDIRSDNLKKLETIGKLKKNWNGNGASPISKKLIKKSEELINCLNIQPEIFPTAMGTIQLEYDNSRRDHMEIEISEDKTAEVFIVTYDGREYFESILSDADNIKYMQYMRFL